MVLNSETKELLYLKGLKIRRLEEHLLKLYREGKIHGTIHTSIGQELIGCLVGELASEQDHVFSNHRCHAHFLGLYSNYRGLLAEIMGSESGINQGLCGSQHLHHQNFKTSGIQASLTPFAAGVGWALKTKSTGGISICMIGDGTFGQGILFEVFNLCAVFQLPVLFVVENNQYAQSTKTSTVQAGSIEAKAKAFGLSYLETNDRNLEDLWVKMQSAVDLVRSEIKPALLEIDTYRLSPHSTQEDFRDPKEVADYQATDLLTVAEKKFSILPRFQEKIAQFEKDLSNWTSEILSEVKSQTPKTLTSTRPPSTEFLTSTYTEDDRLPRFSRLINRSLRESLANHELFLFFGEDVQDPYGGAFKISHGLSEEFPHKVLNFPISESSMVGLAAGLASCGYATIVEIMFGDFALIAFDQIVNVIGKYQAWHSNQQNLPLIIRTPMGGGVGYGFTHSQSLEKFFVGIPGVDCFALHSRIDPYTFYRSLVADLEKPSIIFENKSLYNEVFPIAVPDGYKSIAGQAVDQPHRLTSLKTADITVVAIGGITLELEKAIPSLNREEIFLDIFYPLQLNQINFDEIIESLSTTKKLYILEEGTGVGSVSNYLTEEIVSLLQDRRQDIPILKTRQAVGNIIPSRKDFEDALLPRAESIFYDLMGVFNE